eukprot:TRINITY_DN93451_c0_g1_i1.p1 TRINITY_DN93451_c0_g1~~TRINITY_DN93451_c0_g1_i1.p1  ORF type:complete len:778 (-),score=110.16 TRINITY_DN93451_c0_g1_i1:29-2362(-)
MRPHVFASLLLVSATLTLACLKLGPSSLSNLWVNLSSPSKTLLQMDLRRLTGTANRGQKSVWRFSDFDFGDFGERVPEGWLRPSRMLVDSATGNSTRVKRVSPEQVEHLRSQARESEPPQKNGTVTSTDMLSSPDLQNRQVVYGATIAILSGCLLLASICVFRFRQVRRRAPETDPRALGSESHGEAKTGGGFNYEALPEDARAGGEGLGDLAADELELLGSSNLTKEEKDKRIAEFAQKNAERKRKQHEVYLCWRKALVLLLFILYVSSSIGLPLLHRREASCSQGFFWETHMQFLSVFVLTKTVELCLCAADPTLELDLHLFEFLLKFLSSFMGYLDGYADAMSAVIAHSCHDVLAQQLAIWMAIAYVFGVVILQWLVMLSLAMKDPSQACLLKILHMDLLASSITLPAEQKPLWDMISWSRTLGEDMPQCILQIIYLLKVKENPFMLVSVILAIVSSVKALHDARARALAAAGAADEYESSQKSFVYSCSQDKTIRVWDVGSGECSKVINAGSPANNISVSQGMLYSAHDDDLIREWSLDSGTVTRSFEHEGDNAVLIATSDRLYSWARSTPCLIKEWDLLEGTCLQEFPAPNAYKVPIHVRADRLFTSSSANRKDIVEWSLSSHEVVRTYKGHGDQLNVLFATSKRLLSGSKDGTAKEWSLESGECTRTFADHSKDFKAPLIVAQGLMYNASAQQYVINEWSLATGSLLRVFAGHENSIFGLTLLQERLYSSSRDRTVKEWSLESSECLRTFTGHSDYVNNIVVQYRHDVEEQ